MGRLVEIRPLILTLTLTLILTLILPQGTETCAVVEAIASLTMAFNVLGQTLTPPPTLVLTLALAPTLTVRGTSSCPKPHTYPQSTGAKYNSDQSKDEF